jgi:PST family polysaccharide transporter
MTARTAEGCLTAEPAVSAEAERQQVAAGLAAKARKGTHAIFAIRLLSFLTTFSSITLFARLIPPEHFGIWAIASLALGLVTILRELGLVASVVQPRELTQQQQDSYFWTSVVVSLASAALLALAAPLLARLYDAPLLRPVIWACCVSVAVSGLGFVHAALLRRKLQYNRLVVMEGGGMLCGVGTGLTCAYLWRDVWALVAGHIANAVWISATALLLCRWLPGAPSLTSARMNLSFSLQVTLYNLLNYAGNNVGLAAGYRFSASELGFFGRAQQLCLWSRFALLAPLTDVGFDLLCRLTSDATYRHAYIALARRVSVLVIPCAAVLPIVSADLMLTLLGTRWLPGSPILAWFAPAVCGQAFATLFAQLMLSQHRGDELRGWAVMDLIVRAGGALVGSQFGIVGLAAGFSLATLFLTVPLMAWIAGRRGPVKLRDQLVAVWPGALVAAGATVAAALAASGGDALGLDAGWGRLFFVVGGAVLAWAVLCVLVRPARDAVLGKGMADE